VCTLEAPQLIWYLQTGGQRKTGNVIKSESKGLRSKGGRGRIREEGQSERGNCESQFESKYPTARSFAVLGQEKKMI
jgi:hypothetical protein